MSHLLIVGFMGAGKSTVGHILAEELLLPFVDLDRRIEQMRGTLIRDIFADEGEPAFRAYEHQALESLRETPPSVVACGGGVVVTDASRALMKRLGTVVYLKVTAGEAIARIGGAETRPLLSGGAGTVAATALLSAREALYSAVADITVDTEARGAAEVAREVMSVLETAGI